MNVEIGTEAALFPEKEYIKGIFVAVSNKTNLALDEKPAGFYLPSQKSQISFQIIIG